MTINTTFRDSTTYEPLEDVSVYVVDPSGKILTKGASSGADGRIELQDNSLGSTGNKIQASAIGYATVTLSPQSIGEYVDMDLSGSGSLASVTVSFKKIVKKIQTSKHTIPIVMGAVALAFGGYAFYLKRKK